VKSFPSYADGRLTLRPCVPKADRRSHACRDHQGGRSADVSQNSSSSFRHGDLTSSPEAFAAYRRFEQERWFKVSKDNDIRR